MKIKYSSAVTSKQVKQQQKAQQQQQQQPLPAPSRCRLQKQNRRRLMPHPSATSPRSSIDSLSSIPGKLFCFPRNHGSRHARIK
ncbi:uncharacterized protein LAJ45_08699 [Morchella importuna]|uniref:uncharacterized protein n=1 Tax=Morchella importuna TaxID=1174673 RepID=UPI001E8E7C34|nr:uncharacterized protein LAJ45_08699 [Morchella importuna]KAH8147221.1 hypothetical protein LAJ45_08699 [Morchella importuna]